MTTDTIDLSTLDLDDFDDDNWAKEGWLSEERMVGVMIGCVKLFNNLHNRGDYTEITYYDETDRMVDPQEATRVRIREMLANGAVVKESWGFCGKPVKRPA